MIYLIPRSWLGIVRARQLPVECGQLRGSKQHLQAGKRPRVALARSLIDQFQIEKTKDKIKKKTDPVGNASFKCPKTCFGKFNILLKTNSVSQVFSCPQQLNR